MATPRIKVSQIERDMLARGWNRRELAKAARLSESTITRFLRGDHQTAKALKNIAFALDHSAEHYMSRPANEGKGAAA